MADALQPDPPLNQVPTMDDLLATELGQDKDSDPEYFTVAKSAARTEAIDQPVPNEATYEAQRAAKEADTP